jgi:hypothetical protein
LNNKFLLFSKIGLSLDRCVYDSFEITTNSTVTFVRQMQIAEPLSVGANFSPLESGKYFAECSSHSFCSINLGVGFDYNFSKKAFFRMEYGYKISFSNNLTLRHNAKLDKLTDAEFFNSYSLKYQDKEHCLFFGVGMRL